MFDCLAFVCLFMCLSLRPDWAVQEEDRWLLLPLPVTCSLPAASQVEPSSSSYSGSCRLVAGRAGRAHAQKPRVCSPRLSCVFKRGLVWPCFPFKIRCLKHTTTAQAASQAAHSSGSKDFSPSKILSQKVMLRRPEDLRIGEFNS